MIKKIIKISLAILLILILITVYLSVFGIKTDKFNNQIIDNISKINKKINFNLRDVHYLLNPYNFTINIKTKNPQILLDGGSLKIREIKTNIEIKSLIKNQFSIDDIRISIKETQASDIISLLRIIYNSPQLFVLDTIIKDGLISANIILKFDENGKLKENYKINGSVKKVKLKILNQIKLQNLSLKFDIAKNIYSLKSVDMKLNNTNITSSLIKIKRKEKSFFVNGQFLNENRSFDIEDLRPIIFNLFNDINIKKIQFSSINDFSFNINNKLKLKDLKVKASIDLKELIINEKNLKLKTYFPNFEEELKFKAHKLVIDYYKDKFKIKGSGSILLGNKLDNLSYQIIRNKNNIFFDSKINLKNNSLLIDFLNYEKKEGLSSLIFVKGNFENNNQLNLDLINIKEKSNEILVKDLNLSKNFKILDIKNFNINYRNNKKILNKLKLKKDNSNFIIEGESFDASRIINNIMDKDDESSSFFMNLNSKVIIRIKKAYIDKANYIKNLNGNVDFNNSKIKDLKLEADFPNKKKINLSIKTNKNSEIITRLSSSHPKPLVERYDFIKGFEEGYLDFYSLKKDNISNSVLIIDNFKVKEVPIFAKLLSLASLQGMADILTGEGLRFTDLEMSFSKKKDLTTIDEMYAIGPAVSILMDGYIVNKKLVSLRGTLVPATTINRSISSIPFLGKILVGEKIGEGVFGVSFKIKGPPKKLRTTVNPIKSLTPRFITRTLENIKKN